jgi:hypothetical protein
MSENGGIASHSAGTPIGNTGTIRTAHAQKKKWLALSQSTEKSMRSTLVCAKSSSDTQLKVEKMFAEFDGKRR